MTEENHVQYGALLYLLNNNTDGVTKEQLFSALNQRYGYAKATDGWNDLYNNDYILLVHGSDKYKITYSGMQREIDLRLILKEEEFEKQLKKQSAGVNEALIRSAESSVRTNNSVIRNNRYTLFVAIVALLVSIASIIAPFLKGESGLKDLKITNQLLKSIVEKMKRDTVFINAVKK